MIYIILPVHNEEDSIDETIKRLKELFPDENVPHKIIFINDHSTDQTVFKIMEHPGSCVLDNKGLPGKGSAIRFGLKEIFFKYMTDIVVLLDGDGQIRPYDIFTGIRLMDQYCCSVAIGNKRHPYSTINYNPIRSVISKTYNFIVRKLFNLKLQDTQCGLKVFRAHCLTDIIPKMSIDKFAYDIEMIVALKSIGMRIIDFPISMNEQKNKGSVNIKNIIETFIDTIKVYKKYKKGFYKI